MLFYCIMYFLLYYTLWNLYYRIQLLHDSQKHISGFFIIPFLYIMCTYANILTSTYVEVVNTSLNVIKVNICYIIARLYYLLCFVNPFYFYFRKPIQFVPQFSFPFAFESNHMRNLYFKHNFSPVNN